jgi:AcrR family transcriptional regulator
VTADPLATDVEFVSARRAEIVAIAGELFATRGYANTTVREIADAAGILSGSLYHHFDSKESMIEALMRDFLGDIGRQYTAAASAGTDPVTTLRALVHVAFGALATDRAAVAVMLNEYNVLVQYPRFAFLRDAVEATERLWIEVLDAGMRSGDLRPDVPADAVYRFLRDAIWVSVRWYRPDGVQRPDDIADDYLSMLLGGLATRRPMTRRPMTRRSMGRSR